MDINNSSNKELSTTLLAIELKMPTKAMFQQLVEVGLITRNGQNWELTPAGKYKGGLYKQNEKRGRYIVWPQSIISELDDTQAKQGGNLVRPHTLAKNSTYQPIELIRLCLNLLAGERPHQGMVGDKFLEKD